MRHLGSLIAGIVVAPVAWLLIAFGQFGTAKAFATAASTGAYHTNDFVRPLIFLAVAGIVVGLIATLRISPVGPLVAGVAYVGSYVALLISPKSTYNALAYTVKAAGQTADLTMPLTSGVALAIGAALLVAVASASRWRRWPHPEAAPVAAEPAEPTPAGEPLAEASSSWTTPGWASPTATESGGTESGGTETGGTGTEPLPTGPQAGPVSTGVVSAGSAAQPAADELPSRTSVWPSARTPADSTESVPAKGHSPWDTPLREGNGDQEA